MQTSLLQGCANTMCPQWLHSMRQGKAEEMPALTFRAHFKRRAIAPKNQVPGIVHVPLVALASWLLKATSNLLPIEIPFFKSSRKKIQCFLSYHTRAWCLALIDILGSILVVSIWWLPCLKTFWYI